MIPISKLSPKNGRFDKSPGSGVPDVSDASGAESKPGAETMPGVFDSHWIGFRENINRKSLPNWFWAPPSIFASSNSWSQKLGSLKGSQVDSAWGYVSLWVPRRATHLNIENGVDDDSTNNHHHDKMIIIYIYIYSHIFVLIYYIIYIYMYICIYVLIYYTMYIYILSNIILLLHILYYVYIYNSYYYYYY